MRISPTKSLSVIFGLLGVATGQVGTGFAPAAPTPWIVTVIHSVNTYKLLERYRSQPNVQVGVLGTAPAHTLNVTTGLVVDGEGHVVTRLVTLDPNEADPILSVATSSGNRLSAKLVGVDCATGF